MENDYLLKNDMDPIKETDIEALIRKGFIFKVYGLLTIQLVLTFGFVILANEIKVLKIFIVTHIWFLIVLLFVPFVILILFVCYKSTMNKVPLNYILLFIFTIAEGYVVSFITLGYTKKSVYFVMALTLLAVIALTIYALVTKKDFTLMGGILWVTLTLLILGTILNMFFRIQFLNFIFDIIGVILFSLYIIYDTQLIIGNRENKFSIDDYVLAVINLYLDIINLFLYLLSIFGDRR